MAQLTKKYALVDEPLYNRLTKRSAKTRNPFQNVDVATTKDVGASMKSLASSDVDASTKQMLFGSLLNTYRDSFKKTTGKRKRPQKPRSKTHDGNNTPLRNSPSPTRAPAPIRDDDRVVDRTTPQIRRLPDTPPATPKGRKMKLRKHAPKNVFDDHKTAGVFGGTLSSPTARKLTRVLNEMHREGLVRSGGTFSSINVDGTGMTSSTKIKNTIRNVVLNGGAQTSEQEGIVRELSKRGVRLTK